MWRGILVLVLSLGVSMAAPAAWAQGVFANAGEIADEATSICAAVVVDGQSLEQQLDGRAAWRAVDPRGTGSNLATHAWQSATLNTTYIMRLPNGGCSFGIERGDGEALRARVLAQLTARADLRPVLEEPTRGGEARRVAYCTANEHPLVVSMVIGGERSRPHLVFNMFRAADARPSFCAPAFAPEGAGE